MAAFDLVKLEPACLEAADETGPAFGLMQLLVALGNSLGTEVVAKGVETEVQWQIMRSHGCSLVQGYLFGRPVPAEILEKDVTGRVSTIEC
jgi:EAL domain-containing protein (putative c-di-GMP-specific phosphodiesterase class I)